MRGVLTVSRVRRVLAVAGVLTVAGVGGVVALGGVVGGQAGGGRGAPAAWSASRRCLARSQPTSSSANAAP
jgi:hypothetical protein